MRQRQFWYDAGDVAPPVRRIGSCARRRLGMTGYTVLGADGFIGQHVVRHLRQQGEAVRTPARDAPELHDADLGRVIYCVGLTGDFVERPLDTVDAHVCFFASLLRRARFSSLVYLSSTRLYDGQPGPAHETASLTLDPQDRRHIYDFSKGLGEALCHAFPDRGLVIARLSSVYDDALRADNFLHRLCREALAAPTLEIDTSPTSERDYIHIDDVCRALHRLTQTARHAVYNVASGANLSNRELVDLVSRATGCRITIRERPADRPVPRIDISRLQKEFGISPAPPHERIAALLAERLRRDRPAPPR
jgi:UDP-glucose 4-epimerase